MRTDRAVTFRPRLETLEGRALPAVNIFTPGRPVFVALQGTRPDVAPTTGSATSVAPTRTPRTVSVVPTNISLGLFAQAGSVTPRVVDAGLGFVANGRGDPGVVPAGTRLFAAARPVVTPAFQQIGGFRITTAGVVRG